MTGPGGPTDQGSKTFHQPWLLTNSQSQNACTQSLRLFTEEQRWIARSGRSCFNSHLPPQRGCKASWLNMTFRVQLSGLTSWLCHSHMRV